MGPRNINHDLHRTIDWERYDGPEAWPDVGRMPVNLSRRRLLASASIGAATVLGYPAVSSRAVAYPQTTTVGDGPRIQVSWRETYNGAIIDSSDGIDGPVLNLTDVHPGDSGTVSFTVTADGETHVRPYVTLDVPANVENGRNEPERKAGDDTPSRGELGDAILTTIWFDTGAFALDTFGGCDGTRGPGETVVYQGPLSGAAAALLEGVLLTDDGRCLSSDRGVCVGIAWSLPASTGNRIQGDSVETSLSFTVEACEDS